MPNLSRKATGPKVSQRKVGHKIGHNLAGASESVPKTTTGRGSLRRAVELKHGMEVDTRPRLLQHTHSSSSFLILYETCQMCKFVPEMWIYLRSENSWVPQIVF